ncbi:MAG: hypothetical protein Q8Q62_07455 [Mesorhizobium sp.]|nr:hypothetical protein [Mesorhizobium sp.]
MHEPETVTGRGETSARMSEEKRPFSPLQWHFAISSLTIHFVAACKRPISREVFVSLVGNFVKLAPQLRLSVGRDRNSHHDTGRVSVEADGKVRGLDPLCQYAEVDEFKAALAGHLERLPDIYDNPDLPAFRARGEMRKQPESTGTRSLLSMALAHTLFDGADLARTLAGLPAANEGFDDTSGTKPMAIFRRMAFWLAAAPMTAGYLAMAGCERRSIDDFRFAALSIVPQALNRTAARHGVGRNAMLIAIILRGLMFDRNGTGTVKAMHMRIPKLRFHGQEDRFLHARTEVLRLRGQTDLTTFATTVAESLRMQDFGKSAMPFLTSRMLAVARWLQERLPWLVPEKLKGYAPADIILSIVPPLDPSGPFAEFRDAVMFGGTCTGTAPSCIVLSGPEATTLTFWIEKSRVEERFEGLMALFEREGVPATRWS